MPIFRRSLKSPRAAGNMSLALIRRTMRFQPRLCALEDRTLLSNVLTVTSTNNSGGGSLRAAVASAQPGDTIVFSHKLNGQTITLTSGPIVDSGTSLTIQGPGADKLTISGNNQSGIFNLVPTDPSLPPFAVTITGLTLANAAGPDSSPSYAINDTNASLTLDHDVVADNQSGGVSVINGYQNQPTIYTINVNVTNSTFLDNQSDQSGAAILAASVVFNLSQSLFQGNSATSNSSIGGALYLTNSTFDTFTSSTIASSQFIGNSAVSEGGAIENFGGPITIDSSTFIDNQSTRVERSRTSGATSSSLNPCRQEPSASPVRPSSTTRPSAAWLFRGRRRRGHRLDRYQRADQRLWQHVRGERGPGC